MVKSYLYILVLDKLSKIIKDIYYKKISPMNYTKNNINHLKTEILCTNLMINIAAKRLLIILMIQGSII